MDWGTIGDDAAKASKRPSRCGVRILLDSLDRDARMHLEVALDRTELTHAGIQAALKSRGHDIGYSVLGRHRTGKCACAGTNN